MSYCSDITKNRILECAKEEFLKKGFEKAQVGEIAKAAQVTTGAIYRHFKNKEELFFSLIEEVYTYTLNVVEDVETRSQNKIDIPLLQAGNEAILEASFNEVMDFVNYMYEHFDEFKLIFECSQGSRVENFIEEIVDRYSVKNMKQMSNLKMKDSASYELEEFEVHILTKGYITSLCECIIHNIPYKNVSGYIKSIVTFQYYGWKGLMGRNDG